MPKKAFGELELQIRIILQAGKRMTVKEVHGQLGEEITYNTVMTVMFRLFEKSVLAREKTGLQYVYWIINQPPQTFLNRIKERLFGIKTTLLVSHLLETADDLSAEDLDQIEEIIHKIKEAKK